MSCGLESTFSNTFFIISRVTGLLSVNLRYLTTILNTGNEQQSYCQSQAKDSSSPHPIPTKPVLQRMTLLCVSSRHISPHTSSGPQSHLPQVHLKIHFTAHVAEVVNARVCAGSMDRVQIQTMSSPAPAVSPHTCGGKRRSQGLILALLPCSMWNSMKPECFKFEPALPCHEVCLSSRGTNHTLFNNRLISNINTYKSGSDPHKHLIQRILLLKIK